jgi:arylsulfatase A-like enzyme
MRRAALSLLLAPLACSPRAAAPPGAPNVVLVTIESLRVDHVGAYGGRSPARPELPVTPALDAFAAHATVYEDAHAVTSWTLASHASLFTGLYPTAHQTDHPLDRLDDSYPTLAEVLAGHGYQTAAVVSGPYLRRLHNLSQGFELYDDSVSALTDPAAHSDVTNPRMQAGLAHFVDEQRDPARPFFLFAYYWDPHFDYLPPPPYDQMFVGPGAEPFDITHYDTNPALRSDLSEARRRYLLSQYDGEVRWTDEYLSRLFELLKARGLWDDTLVIVTADHGEAFFEHGEKGHKNDLYAEEVHVPLIVKLPHQTEGRRDARLVSLVDIAPTVLGVAGIEPPFPLEGRSLLDPAAPRERPIYYELLAIRYFRGPEGQTVAHSRRFYGVRQEAFKLVWSDDGEGGGDPAPAQLFDVGRDPGEKHDLAAQEPSRARALRDAFAAGMARAREDAGHYRRGGEAVLGEEEKAQLRALGYLGP